MEVRNVKGVIICMALILLTGCSSFVSMEQLEAEAMRTGDWSLVEQRERIIARRNLRASLQCPPGTVSYCEIGIAREQCTCVDNEIISSLLDR